MIPTRMPACAGALLLTLLMSACAHGPAKIAPATVQPVSNELVIGDAIALLESGDVKAARKKLDAMLKRDPQDVSAAVLKESLDQDPVALLGRKSFVYTTRPGDTMIGLSERFLGTRLKFYALSRYNGIANPSSLTPGQELRIPGEAPRAAPPPPPQPRTKPTRAAETAPKPEAKPKPAPQPVANPARARQLRQAGLAALNRGDVNRAVGLLGEAARLAPDDALIRRDLDRARRIADTVRAKRKP